MKKQFLFADESGCFGFKPGPNVSKNYSVGTIELEDFGLHLPTHVCN